MSIPKSVIPIHNGGISFRGLPPLSLYIHIPYCVQKCPYCDFNSHAIKNRLPEKEYIDALLLDLQSELPNIWGRKIHSIFIGGGTPALFQAASIEYLLNQIRALLPLVPDCEITLEANPAVAEKNRFQDFRHAGITRLSLGVQSLSDKHLRALGRIHTAQEALDAIDVAVKTFLRVNVDLMYALPCQTIDDAIADINTLTPLDLTHISAYQLTIEPHTAFGHQPPENLPDDDFIVDMEQAVHETLQQAGFQRYEISAFARSVHQCQHNLNYWQFGDYLGIGAGAHGKITYPHGIVRTVKHRSPDFYIQAAYQSNPNAHRDWILVNDLPVEFMMNALRLIDGVPMELFTDRTGLTILTIQNSLFQARQQGLLSADSNRLQATPKGLAFLNELISLFLK